MAPGAFDTSEESLLRAEIVVLREQRDLWRMRYEAKDVVVTFDIIAGATMTAGLLRGAHQRQRKLQRELSGLRSKLAQVKQIAMKARAYPRRNLTALMRLFPQDPLPTESVDYRQKELKRAKRQQAYDKRHQLIEQKGS